MPSPGDFSDLFDPCRTHRAANEAYKEGIYVLQEALRLAHVRIVTLRDAPTPTEPKRMAPGATEAAVKRSYDNAVKNWATRQGIPFQRVSKRLRELYEEAHPDA